MDYADGGSVDRVQLLTCALPVPSHSSWGYLVQRQLEWLAMDQNVVRACTVISGSGARSILLLTCVGRCRYVLCGRLYVRETVRPLTLWVVSLERQLSVIAVVCDVKT